MPHGNSTWKQAILLMFASKCMHVGNSNAIFCTKYKAMSVQVGNHLTLLPYTLFSVNQS